MASRTVYSCNPTAFSLCAGGSAQAKLGCPCRPRTKNAAADAPRNSRRFMFRGLLGNPQSKRVAAYTAALLFAKRNLSAERPHEVYKKSGITHGKILPLPAEHLEGENQNWGCQPNCIIVRSVCRLAGSCCTSDSFSFFDGQKAVDGNVSQGLDLIVRPMNFDQIYFVTPAETVVKSGVVGRKVASTGVDFIPLCKAAADHFDASADGIVILAAADGLDADPVVA